MLLIPLIWLLFAHFIGDFALQSEWIANLKGQRTYVLFAHSMIWSAAISLVISFYGELTIPIVLFLVGGHMACDKLKTMAPKTPESWWLIYPDQIFHLVQVVVAGFYGGVF